jgi:hypothetical protein
MSILYSDHFDGATFDSTEDAERLSSQAVRVLALMLDGEWRTLATIADAVSGSEAGVSARLRDLRKVRFGAYQVERRRVEGAHGLHEYRVLLPEPEVVLDGWLF